MPVILATLEPEIRRFITESQPQENGSVKNYLEKPFINTGLVEWLKMKAQRSSPSITKKKMIATQGVFLWNVHFYMCYRLIWFISSIFPSFYLSPFLMVVSTTVKILYSFLYREYKNHSYLLNFLLSSSPLICNLTYCELFFIELLYLY
jgi:hypothetical protein